MIILCTEMIDNDSMWDLLELYENVIALRSSNHRVDAM